MPLISSLKIKDIYRINAANHRRIFAIIKMKTTLETKFVINKKILFLSI